MLFSYNWLQSFFKKNLPKPKKLAELLSLHSFEVSEVEKKGKDVVLNIDVSPNRGDCFSHLGIAREVSAVTGLSFSGEAERIKFLGDKKLKSKDFLSVTIKNLQACPRYTARVITGVRVGSSPKYLRERLIACGLNPINNIVDVANYVMLETGQPLHAFDLEKLEGKKLIVRFAKRGEQIVSLDGEKYNLTPDILVIADSRKPVAIAGIKGGKKPEVDQKTKTIVLESANFSPRIIRRASKRLGLRTDASVRFEHGLDPNLTETACSRAAYLIQEIAGGKAIQDLIDIYPKKVYSRKIKLDLNYADALLGLKIPQKEAEAILKRLGFKIYEVKSRQIKVEIPSFRQDISIAEDLIEEIARIYGYNKIPAVFPAASLIPPKKNFNVFWENMAKDILKQAGLTEVYNYSFTAEGGDLIALKNPVSLEQRYLRGSLIPGLLKNVEKNKGFSEINIFELGKVFQKPKKEKRMLCGILTGKDKFYLAKGVVDFLFQKMGISDIFYKDCQFIPKSSGASVWHRTKLAEIKSGRETLGFLGELLIEAAAFEIDFEKLQKLASEEHEYQPISRFPSALRDIAVLVPRGVKTVEILNKINAAGGPLVRDVDLFDVYEGEELPEGKKSLAFHIIYQSEEKTLSSKEIDELQKKIIKALEEDPEWEVRK
jgi:phenylalanyl-tRNA synthetase beta chain